MRNQATIVVLAAALLLAGRGAEPTAERVQPTQSEAPQPEKEAKLGAEAQPQMPVENAFPVGDPFGDARWSVDIGVVDESDITVRPDRIIVDFNQDLDPDDQSDIQAFTPTGDLAWEYEPSADAPVVDVNVLQHTVAIMSSAELEPTGLDKAKSVTNLTLLALEDGSTVAELQFPEGTVSVDQFQRLLIRDDGSQRTVSESGEVEPVAEIETGLVDEELFNILPLDPSLNVEGDQAKLIMMERSRGVAVLQIFSSATNDHSYYVVQSKSGAVVSEFECPNHFYEESAWVARNSPNGKFGVYGSMRVTPSDVTCIGGGDEVDVELLAIDDSGTAYGSTKAELGYDLVVIPLKGEPEVLTLPQGSPLPLGVMNGDIAVHYNGLILTGNPIE